MSIVCMADGVGSRVGGAGLVPAGFQKAKNERHGMYRRACKILGTEDVWIHQYADNQMDSLPLLIIVKHIEVHVDRFKPTVVYTHWRGDLNVDHRVVHDAVNVACRPSPGCDVKRVLYFEVPCSTAWGAGFTPSYYVEATDLRTKLEAAECYTSELQEFPHPRSMLGIEYLAKFRGAAVGREAAEAFMIGRIVEDRG